VIERLVDLKVRGPFLCAGIFGGEAEGV